MSIYNIEQAYNDNFISPHKPKEESGLGKGHRNKDHLCHGGQSEEKEMLGGSVAEHQYFCCDADELD
jgi:hypothetical protein